MLVDDGEGVIFVKTLFEKISHLNISGFVSQLFETNGRFRPVYWLYQTIVWLVGKNNYQIHHLMHMLVIGITVLFIYLLIKQLTKSRLASFFGALMFLLIPLNTENIMRLGPQEPLMTMFFSVFFYLIVKTKKIFLPCLMLLFVIFTKETALAIFPVIFIYFLYRRNKLLIKNKRQSLYLFITILVSTATVLLITLLRRSGYSTNYNFEISMLFDNLSTYFGELKNNTLYIFPIVTIVYIIRICLSIVRKQKVFDSKLSFFEFLFFLGFVSFLIIQLPWGFALTRYLMPTVFFLMVFSFIELWNISILLSKFKFIHKHKRALVLLIAVFGIYTSLIWGLEIVSKENSSVSYYDAFKKMSSYPEGTILLMNMQKVENTVELVYETQIQLVEFWNRSDIKVDYLDLQNLSKGKYIVVDSDRFLRGYPQDELNTFFEDKFATVSNTSRGIIITTPLELIKQIIHKTIDYLVLKRDFTTDGIYTYYYVYNNWYFYNEIVEE